MARSLNIYVPTVVVLIYSDNKILFFAPGLGLDDPQKQFFLQIKDLLRSIPEYWSFFDSLTLRLMLINTIRVDEKLFSGGVGCSDDHQRIFLPLLHILSIFSN